MIIARNDLLILLALYHVFSLQCTLVTAVYERGVGMGASRDLQSPPPHCATKALGLQLCTAETPHLDTGILEN